MAIKLKILGRDVLIGKRLFGYGKEDEDYFAVLQQKFGVDYSLRERLESYKGLVYSCVNLIGEQCGSYKPIIFKPNGDKLEQINDHELLQLLRLPQGNDPKATSLSQFDLFEATASFIALQGECFWYMARGAMTGKPKEIVILRPDRVGVDVNKETGEVQGYFIRRASGTAIPLEVEEVLHFRTFNPKNPYHGLGTVEAGSDYIDTDEATSKFTKNFFNNNAGLSGVLNIKGEVTKGAFKKFVRAWRDKYQGVDNAGKVAILRESDASFTKVGLGLNELDMSALRQMTRDDVAIMFRVPLPLLGKAEQTGLGRGNVEALEYIFAKYNINAKFTRFDSILQFALRRYWNDDTLVVGHENIVPNDNERELAERDKGVDRWITRNEIRDEDGLDPIDGGDQLFVPLNEVPVNTDLSATAAAGTGKKVTLTIKRKVLVEKEDVDITRKEQFRLRLMRNQTMYERRYKSKMKNILKNQLEEALRNLEAKSSSIKSGEQIFDNAAADQTFVDELTPLLSSMAEQQGGLALTFAGDDDTEFKMTPKILSYLQRSTRKMAGGFNDDTLDRLNNTLSEGIQAGEALGKLQGRVRDVYDNADRVRALRVARTETLKASNAATNFAYKQTDFVKQKEWYVNPDACPICEVFAGKVVGLDDNYAELGQNIDYTDEKGNEQTYAVDYDTVENPPLHPNCRCTIIPVR